MDMLDPNMILAWFKLDYEPELALAESAESESVLTRQIQEMGFESYQFVTNLGGIFVVLMIYLL